MSCDNETGSVLMPDGSALSYDGLPSIKFNCVFPKIPNTVFFLQGWNVPGVSVGVINRATPYLDIDEIGEKMQYTPFTIDFLIDRSMKNYKEIHDWMKRITVNGSQQDEVSDAIVIVNGTRLFRFVDCWPVELGSIKFQANATQMEYLTCSVTFQYDYHEFLDI